MQAQRICSDAMSACVCVSVTFVDSVKKNKHRVAKPFKYFSDQTAWQYSDGTPPPTVASIVVQYIYYTHYKIR